MNGDYTTDTDIPWETYDPIAAWVKRVNDKARELDGIVMANRHISNERIAIILREDNAEFVRIAQFKNGRLTC